MYDRQIRLWGLEAQQRCASSSPPSPFRPLTWPGGPVSFPAAARRRDDVRNYSRCPGGGRRMSRCSYRHVAIGASCLLSSPCMGRVTHQQTLHGAWGVTLRCVRCGIRVRVLCLDADARAFSFSSARWGES